MPSKEYDLELLGEERVIKLLLAIGAQATPALARALYEEGQMAFRGSQKKVPYRKGILKGSGRLFEPVVDHGSVAVTLGYGGAASKYAAAVHELDKNYRNGKQRFYLIEPVEARVHGLDSRLAKRIERIIGEASA